MFLLYQNRKNFTTKRITTTIHLIRPDYQPSNFLFITFLHSLKLFVYFCKRFLPGRKSLCRNYGFDN